MSLSKWKAEEGLGEIEKRKFINIYKGKGMFKSLRHEWTLIAANLDEIAKCNFLFNNLITQKCFFWNPI